MVRAEENAAVALFCGIKDIREFQKHPRRCKDREFKTRFPVHSRIFLVESALRVEEPVKIEEEHGRVLAYVLDGRKFPLPKNRIKKLLALDFAALPQIRNYAFHF